MTTPGAPGSSEGVNIVLIGAAGGGGLFVIILVICIICCVKRKQKKKREQSKIAINRVMPTDMTDFESVIDAPNVPSSKKKLKLEKGQHPRHTSSTVRPMAVEDLEACSRSFDYMVHEEEGRSNLPTRKG